MSKTCPHRGFPLDENGRCPYHGLRAATAERSFGRQDLVHAYDSADKDAIVTDLGENFLNVSMMVKAPWWLWAQNTCDFNHVRTTHPRFGANFHGTPYDIQISEDLSKSSHKIKVRPETVERYRKLVAGPITDHFVHILEYPAVSFTSFLGVFHSVESVKAFPDHSMVTTSFFLSKTREVPKAMLPSVKDANMQILNEDKDLIEKWAPTAVVSRNWLPYEARIEAFNQRLAMEVADKCSHL